MSFLVILLLCTGSAAAVRPRAGPRAWARSGLGAAFVIAGAAHLHRPQPFEQHLPDRVPAAAALVAVTGVAEIGLGVALVAWPARRRIIGIVTAGYLVAVLPANIYVAVAGVEVDGQPGGLFAWIRLPLQGVFIAWAWWCTRTPTDAGPPAPLIDAPSSLPVEHAEPHPSHHGRAPAPLPCIRARCRRIGCVDRVRRGARGSPLGGDEKGEDVRTTDACLRRGCDGDEHRRCRLRR